jgi:hypothetical protein
MPLVADQRHRDDAPRFVARRAGRGHFWFNRASDDGAARPGSRRFAASSRMQSLFFAAMPDRFSLHESGDGPGNGRCRVVDAGKTNTVLRSTGLIVARRLPLISARHTE